VTAAAVLLENRADFFFVSRLIGFDGLLIRTARQSGSDEEHGEK